MSAPAREPGPPTTIDEVIEQLGSIIARSIQEQSRLGYFAARYRKVTIKVKEGIAEGRFDDGPRMERFDVTFANRYLGALNQFRNDKQPGSCWACCLQGCGRVEADNSSATSSWIGAVSRWFDLQVGLARDPLA
jgi:hypothetical protein